MKVKFSLLLIILFTIIFSGYADVLPSEKVMNEDKAPDFELKTLEGKVVKLSDYTGRVVILDFWATWCGPCRRGVPDLVDIQNEFKDEIIIIGISLDQQATIHKLKPFMEQYKINYPVVLGNMDVVKAYGNIQAIPTSFIINKNGEITNKHIGLVSKEKLIEEITVLINQ